jgi:ubiquinone/menaquinone biosynthesis C-methylase UbiE
MHCIITTAINSPHSAFEFGSALAEQLGTKFVVRKGKSLETIKTEYNVDVIILITQKGLTAHTPAGDLFFHLSMADLRIKNLINGKHDHMIAAMDLQPGMSLLDCTLGLGSDAIVASYFTGCNGNVVGLEGSPVIALITAEGLKNFATETDDLCQALRRITVINTDYLNYLKALPDHSFDVVYFDPMFRRPVDSSSHIKPLRFLADNRPLTPEAVREALRVAKHRVVVKETRGSQVFAELGINKTIGGKYSSIQYGVVDVGSETWSD